ncbi:hypothetical protein N7520_012000 [Penicillium odoratum]|uniref:uncharacterized protein n=1 Tax=Penicillium odoratum TaxID=1167516 RepID=UPI0025471654|nr:uncharacterized protein N7520_012000 [Penicillium odoratum]KAJ5746818.1 hypothetical protein N7520_012000 [Penicillium odoratum]
MASLNKQIEERVKQAIGYLHAEDKPNIAKACREFDVPYQRLRARWQGRQSLFDRQTTGQRLDESAEAGLMRWMDLNYRMGLPLKRQQILSTATAILRETEPAAPALNHRWLKRWLKRYPKYKIRRRKSLDRERLKAEDRDRTLKWFEGYENAVSSYGIQREDLYNFNESGFQMGIGQDQWIVTREPRRKIVSGTDTNREYVTVVEAISSDGFAIPPLIILTAKRLSHQWFDFIEDEHIGDTPISLASTEFGP